ncbi:MAG: NAD-dependent epimerase/dehydratase family protein [Myxococcota bacterium]
MRVLVTGAAGFIGSWVTEALLRRGDQVVGVDNFNPYYDPAIKRDNVRQIEAVGGPFEMVRADIVYDQAQIEGIFRDPSRRPDAVCHLAAWAGVRPSIQKPFVYQSVNIEGSMRLMDLCRRFDVRAFVFASSSSVYGARTEVPFRETDPVDDPVSPYAATKKAGELLGYTWHHLYAITFLALRFFTVYGPRQRPEMAIHKFARLIRDGRPIPVHGDGSSSRDYTYIDDCVEGVVSAIDKAAEASPPIYRIYNLGCSETTSLADLIQVIENALGRQAVVERLPEQPGDVPRTFADIERARAELGYHPRTPIRDGVPKFVEWMNRQR